MSQLKNIFVAVAFVLWILPLGVFIKSTDEKKVCGGKRAICMCHVAKGQPATAKKVLMTHPPSNEKETSPSGNSGHFLAANFRNLNNFLSTAFLLHTPNIYSLTICQSIEHVPKV